MIQRMTSEDELLLQTVITPRSLFYGFQLYPVSYCKESDMVEYVIANTSFMLSKKGCGSGDSRRIVKHLAMEFDICETEVLLRFGKLWHSRTSRVTGSETND